MDNRTFSKDDILLTLCSVAVCITRGDTEKEIATIVANVGLGQLELLLVKPTIAPKGKPKTAELLLVFPCVI